MNGWRGVLSLFRKTFEDWQEDRASRMAAAIAYYTVFSLAPLLTVVIAIAGLAFGREAAQGEIVRQLQGLVGHDAAKWIENVIEGAQRPATGVFAGSAGIITLLLGAMAVFGELQDALNRIWDAPVTPGRGIWPLIRSRLLSFTMVLGTGFLLLVSLVLSAGLAALETYFSRVLSLHPAVLQAINSVLSFGVITLLFAMMYRVLPEVEIRWQHVWAGAALTSLLFVLGKFLIGFYLGRETFTSAFGAAGSLVVILVWVYYSAQIFLFGAEFTQVWATKSGAHERRPHSLPTEQSSIDVIRDPRLSPRPDTPGWLGFLTGALVGYASVRGEGRKGEALASTTVLDTTLGSCNHWLQ